LKFAERELFRLKEISHPVPDNGLTGLVMISRMIQCIVQVIPSGETGISTDGAIGSDLEILYGNEILNRRKA
jgi:hypothetical protein